MYTQSLRGYHSTSLFPSPQVRSDAPFWEHQGGDQSPLLPFGVGSDWGLAPGPYLILWPFLVSWSVPPMSAVGAQPSGESKRWSKREPVIPSGGAPARSSRGSFAVAQPSHQSHASRGWHGWNLTRAMPKPVIKEPSTTIGELENSVYYTRSPRGFNTPRSEPQTKGLEFLKTDYSGQH